MTVASEFECGTNHLPAAADESAVREIVKKKYVLARAAIDMEEFSIAELVDLTGVPPKTVETFIGELKTRGLIESLPQPPSGKGRPRNSHRLTPDGRQKLLNDLRLEREKRKSSEAPEVPVVVQSLSSKPAMPPKYPLMIETEHVGAKYIVHVAVPGLERKNLMNLNAKVEEQQLILHGLLEPSALRHSAPFRIDAFQTDVDLPKAIVNPQLMSQDVRNGIWTIEVEPRKITH